MGISLAWVAADGLPVDAVLSRLSLTKTSRHCTYPFKGIASHPLSDGWFLVAAGRCDHRIIGAAGMATLSKGCRAVACAVEEHVNFASAELWLDGQRIWQVRHQGDEDPENMSYSGPLPQRFHDLLASVEPQDSEKLDGHFHMDIPLVLAKELAGFRHDESDSVFDATPFDELHDMQVKEAKGGWWKVWK